MSKVIHVAAGVIRDGLGQILIARRPDHTHQGGLWEFPGGKLESGESVQEALGRELQEELGIRPTKMAPLIQIRHDYPDKSVLLDVWDVTAFDGQAHGKEGQPITWVRPDGLQDFQFPAANVPIVTAARLPQRLLITGDESEPDAVLKRLAVALDQGIRLVQLRQTTWGDPQWQSLGIRAKELCERHNARLILNSTKGDAGTADGIHLTSAQLMGTKELTKTPGQLVSASCHNNAELDHAEALGLDFVTLSPVAATASHPDAEPLGWERFAELVAVSKLPVYALGGMTDAELEQARAAGAQGIAGIRAWWG